MAVSLDDLRVFESFQSPVHVQHDDGTFVAHGMARLEAGLPDQALATADVNLGIYDEMRRLEKQVAMERRFERGVAEGDLPEGTPCAAIAAYVASLQHGMSIEARDGATRETLLAIDNKDNRFVMSGSTFTDWDGVGDPQDFYLVQTDPNKKTQCVRDWDYSWSPAQFPRVEFTPPIKSMPSLLDAQTPDVQESHPATVVRG